MFEITTSWKTTYPDAHAGILVMHGVDNPATCPELERRKQDLEEQLRTRFIGQDRKALDTIPTISAYNAYYKQFKKTYHVQAQLESIAFKGRTIPSVGAVVTAMFMAEVKNLLLTAGHDWAAIQPPLRIDVATGSEQYVLINGQEQATKPGDMLMADAQGVISSVIYGPDQRTRITAATRQVLFVVYAPVGIGEQAVRQHLEDIRTNVVLAAPEAAVESLDAYVTG